MIFAFFSVTAALAWIGWFTFAPAIGFPDTSPVRVLEGVTGAAWLLVLLGLAIAATLYRSAVRRGVLPTGLRAALLYGVAIWLVVGAVVMPVLSLLSDAPVPAASMGLSTMAAEMRPTFMMLGAGFLAPLAGLVAWLLFAAILGTAPVGARHVHPRESADPLISRRMLVTVAIAIVVVLAIGSFVVETGPTDYEVWVIDQAGTGTLYIYPRAALMGDQPPEPEVIDLRDAGADVGDGHGEMPHMLRFNSAQTHGFIPNRSTGHVYVMRLADREIVASIDVGEGAHDVQPSPDGTIALVSKDEDKAVGVIRTDYENEEFTYELGDDLRLARLEGKAFPETKPRCALFPSSDRVAYVTLSGGGLLVVDARDELRIIKKFTVDQVVQSGCGAATRGDKFYVSWGGSDVSTFYVFDYENHTLLHSVPIARYGPDGHGMTLVGDGRYAWVAIRLGHAIAIVDVESERAVGTIDGFGIGPDMPVVAPSGEFVFLTLRGPHLFDAAPKPPPEAKRMTPGIVVFRVLDGGRTGVPEAFIPMSPALRGHPPDPHAIAIRTV